MSVIQADNVKPYIILIIAIVVTLHACFSCATATLFDSLVGNRKPVYNKQHTEDANVKKMLKISTLNLDVRTYDI